MCVRVDVLPEPPLLTVVTRVSTYQPGDVSSAENAGANTLMRHATHTDSRMPRNVPRPRRRHHATVPTPSLTAAVRLVRAASRCQ